MERNTENLKDGNRMISIGFEKQRRRKRKKIIFKINYINVLPFFILSKVWNNFHKYIFIQF